MVRVRRRLAYVRENFEDEDPRNSVEAILGTQYTFYQYDTPKRSLDAGFAVFPSLTESERVRAEADVTSRFELVKDLFFDLSLYGSYDTDPGETAESNSDYGVVTSLGYSFLEWLIQLTPAAFRATAPSWPLRPRLGW